ncbi:hypothetical protein [Geomesophilobacter sediminis]|uniref:Uncharacterized protein n=1 Tax=Geomesophilobacter sediminis TaxID=2798584 RepID=A0A8J7IPU5_9BACT|nr:hypothetical protein [Geomesophilobacter sediminis]MBJ6724504.1 hypothetical protein [Geomesophilobacter sediminis]
MTSKDAPRRPSPPASATKGAAVEQPASETDSRSFSNLLNSVNDFAATVGSRIVSPRMEEYVEQLQNDGLRHRIIRTNDALASRGFRDTSRSTVRTLNDAIYYPVVYTDGDEVEHFAAPFFDTVGGSEPFTVIEGGHMAGLALAARELKERKVLQPVIRRTLAPVQGKQLAEGDRRNGYRTPLIYRSEAATVIIHYTPNSENSGTVEVEAESNTDGSRILGKKWEVRFA